MSIANVYEMTLKGVKSVYLILLSFGILDLLRKIPKGSVPPAAGYR